MSVPTNHGISGNGLNRVIWRSKAEKSFQRLLAEVMERSGKGRAQIAAEMSAYLDCPPDQPIRKQALDDYVRSRKKGRQVRFPAPWIPALCSVTGSDTLQRHLLDEHLLQAMQIGEGILESDAKVEMLVASAKNLRRLRSKR
jgi:hypothetical protein